MKKMMMIGSVLGLLTANSFAVASNTGDLDINGTIPAVVTLSVATTNAGTNMDLTIDGGADITVANVTENSNTLGGYTIEVDSANNGSLNHDTLADTVTYTADYDGNPVDLTATNDEVKEVLTGGTQSDTSAFIINFSNQVASTLAEGNYSDTITFTIIAQ